MKLSIFFTILLSFNTFATGYYGSYVPSSNDDSKPRMRAAVPVSLEEETFYGTSMAQSGFSMVYPESYVRVMKYCYGLSTDANKMMDRALKQNDKKTVKRLECYTKGLGRDLFEYEKNGLSAIEIATENRNSRAINYLNSL